MLAKEFESARDVESAKEEIYAYIQEIAANHVRKVVRVAEQSPELTTATVKQTVDDIFEDTRGLFYNLLLFRNARARLDIVAALDKVIESPDFKAEGGLKFINRCFYSICNYWHLNAGHKYITEHLCLLIQYLLDELPTKRAQSRCNRLLQQRMQAFRDHDYTTYLQRQRHLSNFHKTGKVIDVLHDFPYLWGVTTHTKETDKSVRNAPRTGIGEKLYQRRCNDYSELQRYIRQCKNRAPNLVVPLPWDASIPEFNRTLKYFKTGPSGIFRVPPEQLEQKISISKDHKSVSPIIWNYTQAICQDLPQNIARRYYRGVDRALNDTIEKSADGVAIGEIGKINLFQKILQVTFLPELSEAGINNFRQCLEISGARSLTGMLLGIVVGCPMARFKLEEMLGYLYEFFEAQSLKVTGWL
ncbi:MAG: hypothetical protein AAF959_29220, partial [Cyanobacteria bacterium P01_D01_bin.56]